MVLLSLLIKESPDQNSSQVWPLEMCRRIILGAEKQILIWWRMQRKVVGSVSSVHSRNSKVLLSIKEENNLLSCSHGRSFECPAEGPSAMVSRVKPAPFHDDSLNNTSSNFSINNELISRMSEAVRDAFLLSEKF